MLGYLCINATLDPCPDLEVKDPYPMLSLEFRSLLAELSLGPKNIQQTPQRTVSEGLKARGRFSLGSKNIQHTPQRTAGEGSIVEGHLSQSKALLTSTSSSFLRVMPSRRQIPGYSRIPRNAAFEHKLNGKCR